MQRCDTFFWHAQFNPMSLTVEAHTCRVCNLRPGTRIFSSTLNSKIIEASKWWCLFENISPNNLPKYVFIILAAFCKLFSVFHRFAFEKIVYLTIYDLFSPWKRGNTWKYFLRGCVASRVFKPHPWDITSPADFQSKLFNRSQDRWINKN